MGDRAGRRTTGPAVHQHAGPRRARRRRPAARQVRHEGPLQVRRRVDARLTGPAMMMLVQANSPIARRGRGPHRRRGAGRPRRLRRTLLAVRAHGARHPAGARPAAATPKTSCRTSSCPPCGSSASCARRRPSADGSPPSRAIARSTTSAIAKPQADSTSGSSGRCGVAADQEAFEVLELIQSLPGGLPRDADPAAGGRDDGAGDRRADGPDAGVRAGEFVPGDEDAAGAVMRE